MCEMSFSKKIRLGVYKKQRRNLELPLRFLKILRNLVDYKIEEEKFKYYQLSTMALLYNLRTESERKKLKTQTYNQFFWYLVHVIWLQ